MIFVINRYLDNEKFHKKAYFTENNTLLTVPL